MMWDGDGNGGPGGGWVMLALIVVAVVAVIVAIVFLVRYLKPDWRHVVHVGGPAGLDRRSRVTQGHPKAPLRHRRVRPRRVPADARRPLVMARSRGTNLVIVAVALVIAALRDAR